MRLQILSDLHLETEVFEPEPAPGADLLVLAGDIDSSWQGYARFAGWPVPVLVVPGNHEFDRRELRTALPAFRDHCAHLGLQVLERDEWVYTDKQGRCVRFLGTVRWSDFEVFGPALQAKAIKAAGYFQKVMQATYDGRVFDAAAVREEALACRAWLKAQLDAGAAAPAPLWPGQPGADAGRHRTGVDATVVITHFAPSLRSADPRYGQQPTTASFCNADEELMRFADGWIHGHVHWRSDYRWPRPDGGSTRVICQARGLPRKGESEGFDPLRLFKV